MNSRLNRLLLLIALLIALFLLPVLLWFIERNDPINVAIINKTVPNESFQKHFGVTWILNHHKKTSERLDHTKDYFGFIPDETKEAFSINQLPRSYDDVDLIYIADTYGVYEDDFFGKENQEHPSQSSSLIYGGLSVEEWTPIRKHINTKPSTLIVEYNSLPSATSTVEQDMSNQLNISRTGWTGRYFKELNPELNHDIPQWLIDHYQENWEYHGSGFVMVNEESEEILVLKGEEHFKGEGVKLQFTEAGQQVFDLKQSTQYTDWFDIVVEKDSSEVLAYHELDLTNAGKDILQKQGIPHSFAAIIRHEKAPSINYYFAGSYNDLIKTTSYYQYKWLTSILKWINLLSDSPDAFFWDTYAPMMKTIINEEKILSDKKNTRTSETVTENQLDYSAKINGDSYEVLVNGSWEKLLIKGVNLGMAKPGTFPGEAAITYEEYMRWFKQMGEMDVNTIRIYTLHPPDFYNALKDYNEGRRDPLYLFHGIWIDETPLEETLDAFHPSNIEEFQNEMKKVVDVVHGNAEVRAKPGHAHGWYDANISQYLIGWIIGVEWYPHMVEQTNHTHTGIGEYEGRFITTEEAAPFEYWLAEQMDLLLTYEANEYQFIRPVSFTNWVTTDLLEHPAEPSPEEDMVGVNPNVIHMEKEARVTNQFASYHVYPYYPDFLNYEEEYIKYKDHRGNYNNYAGYLHDLHKSHDIPILIAEFGVPSSRGLTHENPFGWNQGFLSEKEQGEIVKSLFEDIVHEGLLGGLVFTWQDEWFKRTWNTMDYDNPDRRPFWSNAQTNEQQFGLLSFDRHKIKVDGQSNDWKDNTLLYSQNGELLESLSVDHDERYLYLKIEGGNELKQKIFKDITPMILLDTIPRQGNHHFKEVEDVIIDSGIDFVIDLQGKEQSAVKIDPYYDSFKYDYWYEFSNTPYQATKNSGEFNPIYLALNQEMLIPNQNKVVPFSYYETGKLKHGVGNPESADYNSLADFYVNETLGIIELRIPWMMLNITDPSSLEVIDDLFIHNGAEGRLTIEGINVGVLLLENNQIIDSFPTMEEEELPKLHKYSWEEWEIPEYEERLKQSYYYIQEAFKTIN
ncbi:hypothetical protein RYX56_18780 [Alkalihalophilus lindianensis]|uniref:Family 2 glycosyl transferase n=1 Tax=Alkalihalophilus lindianensis TaxID=1630542 RepID=A0ABU3XGI3_9BACI|nr:hypothetical protein [Alkalihalophilus lindianensis]MDV2686418.1 hypothetical protein [Alkalihalophilus lindianensis]